MKHNVTGSLTSAGYSLVYIGRTLFDSQEVKGWPHAAWNL